MNAADLEKKTWALLDGSISEADARALRQLLDEQDHRKRFVQLLDMHATLASLSVHIVTVKNGSDIEIRWNRACDTPNVKRRWIGKRSLRLWPALTAAAALLALIGGQVLLRDRGPDFARDYAMGRIVKAIGPLSIADQVSPVERITRLELPSESLCRLDRPDGTAIAVKGPSSLDWREDRISGANALHLAEGLAYMDVAPQKTPIGIVFPNGTRADILGTRLLAGRSGGREFVSVFEGQVRAQMGQTLLTIGPGQTAPVTDGAAAFCHLLNTPVPANALTWLAELDFDMAKVDEERKPSIRHAAHMAFQQTIFRGGAWRMERKDDGYALVQDDADATGLAVAAGLRLLSGEFRCQARVTRTGARPTLGVAFLYPVEGGGRYMEALNVPPDLIPPMLAKNTLLNIRVRFQLHAHRDTLHVREFEVWPDGHREQGWKTEKFERTPQNTTIPKRPVGYVGVYAEQCAVEFFDLDMDGAFDSDSVAAASAAGAIRPDGILFQDDFEQGLQSHWIPLQGEWRVIEKAGKDRSAGLSCLLPTLEDGTPAPAYIGLRKNLQNRHFEISWDWYAPVGLSGEQIMRIELFKSLAPVAQAFYSTVGAPKSTTIRPGWQTVTCRVRDNTLVVFVNEKQQAVFNIEEPFAHIALVAAMTEGSAEFKIDNVVVRELP